MSTEYAAAKAHYSALPAFTPPLSQAAIPYVSLILLGGAFLASFAFTTLPKKGAPILDAGLAMLASVLFGMGTVATFAWVGVSV